MQALPRNADFLCQNYIGTTYTQDADRQWQLRSNWRNRGETRPVLAVQYSEAASSRKLSELSCQTKTGQELFMGSDTGSSTAKIRQKKTSRQPKLMKLGYAVFVFR